MVVIFVQIYHDGLELSGIRPCYVRLRRLLMSLDVTVFFLQAPYPKSNDNVEWTAEIAPLLGERVLLINCETI